MKKIITTVLTAVMSLSCINAFAAEDNEVIVSMLNENLETVDYTQSDIDKLDGIIPGYGGSTAIMPTSEQLTEVDSNRTVSKAIPSTDGRLFLNGKDSETQNKGIIFNFSSEGGISYSPFVFQPSADLDLYVSYAVRNGNNGIVTLGIADTESGGVVFSKALDVWDTYNAFTLPSDILDVNKKYYLIALTDEKTDMDGFFYMKSMSAKDKPDETADKKLMKVSNDGELKITVDGKTVEFTDAKPFIDETGRTQVPLRAVCEAAGMNVDWLSDTQTVSVYSSEYRFNFQIDAYSSLVEHKVNKHTEMSYVNMEAAPVMINDRVYIQARYIAQAMGMTVEWDEAENTVIMRPMNDSDFTEPFPGDKYQPKWFFDYTTYSGEDIPEEILNALSRENVIEGDMKDETIFDKSVDISNSVYKCDFHLPGVNIWSKDENAKSAFSTCAFDPCERIAIYASVRSIVPVWIDITMKPLDSNDESNIEDRRMWHAYPLGNDNDIVIVIDNVNKELKSYLNIMYYSEYTPNIDWADGTIKVCAF